LANKIPGKYDADFARVVLKQLAGWLYFAREKTLVERRSGRVRQSDELAYGIFFLGEWGGRLRINDGEHIAAAHSAQQQTVGLDTDDSIFFVEDEFFSHVSWMPFHNSRDASRRKITKEGTAVDFGSRF
jgi:hypothetical protein